MNRKGFAPIVIIGIVAFFAIAGAIGYFVLKKPVMQLTAVPIPGVSTTTSGNSHLAAQDSNVPPEFQNKIAFLKAGEVWLANEDGSGVDQFTHTSGTIKNFSFSPTFSYLAYTRIVSTTTFIDNEGGSHLGNLYDVEIIDVASGSIVRTITKDNLWAGEFPFFGYWYSDKKFAVSGEDFLSADGPFIFDVDTLPSSPYSKDGLSPNDDLLGYGITDATTSNQYEYNDFQIVGSKIFYTASVFKKPHIENFLLFDPATGKSNIFGSAPIEGSYIEKANMNPMATDVVFVEGQSQPYASKVLLYSSGGTLYTASSTDGSTSYLAIGGFHWSFDGTQVAFRLNWQNPTNKQYKSKIISLSLSDPSHYREIDDIDFSTDFQWTRSGKIIFEKNNNLYQYDPQSGTEALLSASSSDPFAF